MDTDQRKIIKAIAAKDSKGLKNILSKKESLVNEQIKLITVHTPLSFAIISGDVNILLQLIEMGADVNASLNNGQAPIHLTCNMNNEKMTEVLLLNQANVNAVDNNGNNPFFYLLNYASVHKESNSKHNHVDTTNVARLLMNHNINIEHKNKKGISVFDIISNMYKNTSDTNMLNGNVIKTINEMLNTSHSHVKSLKLI